MATLWADKIFTNYNPELFKTARSKPTIFCVSPFLFLNFDLKHTRCVL